jgi:ribonuclease BN (tRNA processing enzyme)
LAAGHLSGPGCVRGVEFAAGDQFAVGPFQVQTWQLPHRVPSAGVRLAAAGRVLAYTGDTGPSPAIAELTTWCAITSWRPIA